jgi:hypothetical protein
MCCTYLANSRAPKKKKVNNYYSEILDFSVFWVYLAKYYSCYHFSSIFRL